MSLKPVVVPILPAEIAAWGDAHLAADSAYRVVGDTLYDQLHAIDFSDLYHPEGKPGLSPVVLALVTIFQQREQLADRAAAEAVRTRLDWKYALHLPLHDAGFDSSVLCEFRQRLLDHAAEARVFDAVVDILNAEGLIRHRGIQRSDSTYVLAAVRSLHRLETVGEAMRSALNTLATVSPDWLVAHALPDWYRRYGPRFDAGRLPTSQAKRTILAEQIGQDGHLLLQAIADPASPKWLAAIPAVELLRQIWLQQYYIDAQGRRWRDPKDLPSASLALHSPYDPDARYSSKRSTIWVGYKVHLTETCDADMPRIITNVEVTPAPAADTTLTDTIHAHLAETNRLPATHLADAGYIDAEHLVVSQRDYQIDLLGPVPVDPSWQAREKTGCATGDFRMAWDAEVATCPAGQQSSIWREEHDDKGTPTIHIEFAGSVCRPCPLRAACTRSKRGRQLNIRRQASYEALQIARTRQKTPEFKAAYAQRAGIEGTISRGVRAVSLRKSRYRGQAKTTLQELFVATALNVARVSEWLAGQRPARPRIPALVRLLKPPSLAELVPAA